jgi:SOS-response transcriptional repressor LexA
MECSVQNARRRVKAFRAICARAGVKHMPMKTPADRLRHLVARDFPEGANAAARRFGWNKNTFGAHVRGVRGIKLDEAVTYANAFGVTAGWLMFGEGRIATDAGGAKPVRRTQHNVVVDSARVPRIQWGMIVKTSTIAEAVANADCYIDLPSVKKFGQLAFALVVEDESMLAPEAPQMSFDIGQPLVFDPSVATQVKPGDFVLARVDGLDVEVFRQMRRAGKDADGRDLVDLVPLNPHYETHRIVPNVTGHVIARLVYRGQSF